LEYFAAIWYTLWPIGNAVVIWYVSAPALVCCVKKNLATLSSSST
jgi:hypothetical protein